MKLFAEVHVHVHHHNDGGNNNTDLEIIMAGLDELTSAVEAETSVNQSAITLLNQLAQQIRDAADDPAALAALADQINQNANALSEAVAANTPAAPQA